MKHEDEYALSVLGPVLAGARTARLTKALVYDKPSAASISAFQGSSEDVGEFGITVTPRPGSTLTALEQEIDVIVERLKKEGPTAQEIQAAIAPQELQFVSGLQSNLGKTNQLADGAGYHNDPGLLQKEYEKRRAVTPDDVEARGQQVPDGQSRHPQRGAGREVRPRGQARGQPEGRG